MHDENCEHCNAIPPLALHHKHSNHKSIIQISGAKQLAKSHSFSLSLTLSISFSVLSLLLPEMCATGNQNQRMLPVSLALFRVSLPV